MVISFSVKEARDQLMNKGLVFTFRWTRRKRIGKDWANKKRGTKKITDVYIKEIMKVNSLLDLVPYVSLSGFDSLEEWKKVIRSMNKNEIFGWLYGVTRVSQQLRTEQK